MDPMLQALQGEVPAGPSPVIQQQPQQAVDPMLDALMNPASAPKAVPAAPSQSTSWSDVPRQALQNLPESAVNFATGLAHTVMHPIDTLNTVLGAALGGARKMTPDVLLRASDAYSPLPPETVEKANKAANAVGEVLKGRYGGMENLKNTIATDPVGAAADVSAVLSGGAGLMREGGTAANVLGTAAKYTNPITPVASAVKGTADLVGNLGAHSLGLTTGVGAENIKNAYRAQPGFYENMSGKVPMTQVVDDAKAALLRMKQEKSRLYRSGMLDVSNDSSQLDFSKLDNAVSEAKGIGTYKGEVINQTAADKVGEMSQIIEDWLRKDPKVFHTPEGFDALKQKLGSVLESIPYNERQARLAAGKIYNAAKDTIVEQAPTYAKVMKDYSEASDTISELERAFSLKDRSAADTALRKLQSLTRNNVSTNYGNRLSLAQTLQDQGGASLLPALSGQAMNSWTPRGLTGVAPVAETIAALSSGNPAPLLLAPLSSPRAVGTALYGAGRVANALPSINYPAVLLMQRAGALSTP